MKTRNYKEHNNSALQRSAGSWSWGSVLRALSGHALIPRSDSQNCTRNFLLHSSTQDVESRGSGLQGPPQLHNELGQPGIQEIMSQN